MPRAGLELVARRQTSQTTRTQQRTERGHPRENRNSPRGVRGPRDQMDRVSQQSQQSPVNLGSPKSALRTDPQPQAWHWHWHSEVACCLTSTDGPAQTPRGGHRPRPAEPAKALCLNTAEEAEPQTEGCAEGVFVFIPAGES